MAVKLEVAGQRQWEILCACARTATNAGGADRLDGLPWSEIDWERFYALARRHGVMALLQRALCHHRPEAAPAPWLAKVRREALAHGRRNLLTAKELVRLMALLEMHGIGALALKGPALAMQAYGDLALRQYGDLDIWVRPQDVAAAGDLLLQDAYFSDGTVFESERPYGRRDGWVVIDLHWSATTPLFAGLVDEAGMWARAQTVALAGGQVRTLGVEDHLLALAVHGCKDGWSRLKWVCDVAALLRRHPALAWDELVQQAEARGSLRILWVALALARRLLDAELPGPIRSYVDADAAARRLAAQLATGLLRGKRPGVLAAAQEEFAIHIRSFTGLKRRSAYTGRRLRSLLTPTAEDRASLPLPAGLDAIYYLTRPLRLVWSYGRPWLRA